jgi:hypothetical protein
MRNVCQMPFVETRNSPGASSWSRIVNPP